MPETRVLVADIKAFPYIYRTFQFHQFDWIDNEPGDYTYHLTREFYSSYAATLMNFVADTETTKRGQRDIAITWGPLNSIIVRGKSVDISEATINRTPNTLHRLQLSFSRENIMKSLVTLLWTFRVLTRRCCADCKTNCHRWGECNLGHHDADTDSKNFVIISSQGMVGSCACPIETYRK
ncbi:hypothetical protein AABB24_009587 [Solanum stoloniferum]|uniref:Uncharacterized protein n=1 Tax=Solanum stoloniferum TaxID=62892 RepID=A0ABD2UL12_9SOLN